MKVLALFLTALLVACAERTDPQDRHPPTTWLESFRKSDGAYGPPEAPSSQLVWTWRVLRCQELMGVAKISPANAATLLKTFEATALRANQKVLLGDVANWWRLPPPELPDAGTPVLPLTTWVGSPPLAELEDAVRLQVQGEHPVQKALVMAILGVWRAPDGGWRFPASPSEVWEHINKGLTFTALPKGDPGSSPLAATASAVQLYALCGRTCDRTDELKSYLLGLIDSQTGAFRPGIPEGAAPKLWSTWHGLRSLQASKIAHPDEQTAQDWILAHQTSLGGFALSPGEPPSLEATWLAIECLSLLGLPASEIASATASSTNDDHEAPPPPNDADLKLFQAMVEMGPDPATSVALAHAAGASLLLIKSLDHDEERLAAQAQAVAKAMQIDLAVACAREEHTAAFGTSGVGYATHCSDIIWAPGTKHGTRGRCDNFASLANAWKPDQDLGVLVFGCGYRHAELLRPAYDLAAKGEGYDALMFTWGIARHGDLVAQRPWLHPYVGRVAAIGNHDAHGDPYHWFHRGIRARTLFFAQSGDLDGLRDAVLNQRTVAVAHTPKGPVCYGSPKWRAEALRRQSEWDLGRAAHTSSPWCPKPLVIPINSDTRFLWPELETGHGLMIRAARAFGDEALCSDVQVFVDRQEVETGLLPPQGYRPPVIVARLPRQPPGPVEVKVSVLLSSGDRVTGTQQIPFGEPVHKGPQPAQDSRRPPSRLSFDSADAFPFVLNTSLAPGDFEGSIGLVTRRADLLLGPKDKAHNALRIKWTQGSVGRIQSLSLNGRPLTSHILDNDNPDTLELIVPVPPTPSQAINVITLRTNLDPWIQSFPHPSSDLVLLEVSWDHLQ